MGDMKRIDLGKIRSLRGIGAEMLQPPVDVSTGKVTAAPAKMSLRELRARHRFIVGQQPSFREVARRREITASTWQCQASAAGPGREADVIHGHPLQTPKSQQD